MEFTSEWFDESSKAWLLNKRKRKNCVYTYRCQKVISPYGKTCNKDTYKTSGYCVKHWATSTIKEVFT